MSEVEPPELGFPKTSGATDTLASWQDYEEQAHIVQFYETDDFLIGEASRFIGTAMGSGNAGVVIATKPHRGAIADRLASFGLDPRVAIAEGRYVALDAAETLATFMVGHDADPERFARGIGDVIDRARRAVGRSDARVAAFGEMVALLWAEGKKDAAIRLEQLWNALAKLTRAHFAAHIPSTAFRSSTIASLSCKSAENMRTCCLRKAIPR